MKGKDDRTGRGLSDYTSFGWFDPLLCRRIIEKFQSAGIRYSVRDASGVGMEGAESPQYFKVPAIIFPVLHRRNGIDLSVDKADVEQAKKIIDAT